MNNERKLEGTDKNHNNSVCVLNNENTQKTRELRRLHDDDRLSGEHNT